MVFSGSSNSREGNPFYGRGGSVPKKEEGREEKNVEPKEEDGIIDLVNLISGIGFIAKDKELIGLSLDTQWVGPHGGAIIPQKGDPVKFIREKNSTSPRANIWWYTSVPQAKALTKPAALSTRQDIRYRIMRQVPGEAEEKVLEGSLREINSEYGRRPSKNQDPIIELRRAVNGRQPEVWFEENRGGGWKRCDDRRPPFKEQRPQSGKRREKIHRS